MIRSQTIHTTYEPIKLTGHKRVPCTVCGKTLKRQNTVWRTVNPFHSLTAAELMKENHAELDAWQKEPETCKGCK